MALASFRQRERREALRRAHRAELATAATAATLRRLRKPTLDAWLAGGRIGQEQHQAGAEIARIFAQLTIGLTARTGAFLRQPSGAPSLADWRPGLARAFRERYAPWRAEAERVLLRPGLPVAWLVFSVAIDNLTGAQLARHYRLAKDGAAERAVQGSLWRYAEIAGWIAPRPGQPPPYDQAALLRATEALAATGAAKVAARKTNLALPGPAPRG